jgi:alkanesulfonate monooxygenase SsuD/methylene tetrahydromethanopterin reductase-like flavin-dependent oxidoreductase (luciferase family)
VIAADAEAEAQEQLLTSRRLRATGIYGQRGHEYTDEEADLLLEHGAAAHVDQMLTYSAIGTPTEVREAVQRFVKQADANELSSSLLISRRHQPRGCARWSCSPRP